MRILEALKLKVAEENVENKKGLCTKLLNLANSVVENAGTHLKLIISQLPEFDIHDATHSEKVLSNIEALMSDDLINRLSAYELFLIYLSSYLHDCAMALPEWEVRLLKLTEGTEEVSDDRIINPMKNDFKPPFKMSEALKVIEERKEFLYGSFDNVKEYIFSCKDEEEFKRDLAERLIDYQEFRNGFIEELREIKKSNNKLAYLEFSDLIRYDYIRHTHSKRAGKYIANLAKLFCDSLGGMWGNALVKDLADICKAHGENYDFITNLEVEASYFGIATANIQFVSTMLRLGDVLHFSFDRAPRSLFSEKMISSKESIKHWKAKFQGLNYSIGEIDGNGRIKIKYIAYCEEPSAYYFIQDYLNWVDDELSNYFKFIHALNYSINTRKLVDRYTLNIAEKVDRTQLKYNENKFIPVPNARFTLNQKKILELLMGVGLYKNKYLCLREIYQNSLDACRCMLSSLSSNNLRTSGYIEFGIGESFVDGIKKKYLYCLDNGIGMTKDIVERFFLNIGNSYYKSRDFYKRSIKWNNSFKPTSQFGIGILSCFMIGNRIEITTKALDDNEYTHNAIRFSIDGPHENFYYIKPDELDLEKLGAHGTYLKVFLSDNDLLNNNEIPQLPLIIHGEDKREFTKSRESTYKVWENNLYKLLISSIGIVDERINVHVKFDNDITERLIPWTKPLDIDDENISTDDVKLLYSDYKYILDGYAPYMDFLMCKDFIHTHNISVELDGIEYHTLISLPKPGIPLMDYRILDFPQTIVKSSGVILVDGVLVSDINMTTNMEFDDRRDIARNGIFNFKGPERPQLTVDRNSVTNMPDSLKESLNRITSVIAEKIVEIVSEHNTKYNLKIDSNESRMLWDYLLNRFGSMCHIFIKYLTTAPNADIILDDLSKLLNNTVTANKFINMHNVNIDNFIFKELRETSELLLIGKLARAEKIEVQDTRVSIDNKGFDLVSYPKELMLASSDIKPIVIKADSWDGKFKQYDLVSNLWPIVPERLFNNLSDRFENIEVTDRAKFTSNCSNSLAAIAQLKSALINPKFGISELENDPLKRKKNLIGRCEKICSQFWMFELNDHGMLLQDGKDYFVYTFINANSLSQEEQIKLESYKEEDPVYYEGVLKGWSILFLGKTAEIIILPGIVDRNEAVRKIKNSFWTLNDKIQYYFLDGTIINKL